MKIHRTYPQPDSPQPHLGPRERAMAVYKYLLDLEPEVALHHPRFPLMVAAFEQAERVGWNRACSRVGGAYPPILPEVMPESIMPLVNGSTEMTDVEVRRYASTADRRAHEDGGKAGS